MFRGILFYSNNGLPIPQFVVALYSLRKFYSGNVHIVFGPNTPSFFPSILKKSEECTFSFAKRHWNRSDVGSKRQEWQEKPFIISKESPFEETVYYDCDHVFFKNFDLSIFDSVKDNGLITSIEKSYASRHDKILRQVNKIAKKNLTEIEKFNGGCVGYLKDCLIMDKVIEIMRLYSECDESILKKNSEEFAFATVVKEGFGGRVDEKWSYGYPKNVVMESAPENAIAIHFCVGRFKVGNLWYNEFLSAYNNNYLELRDRFNEYSECENYLLERSS